MQISPSTQSQYSPGVLSMIPIFYAGWSDSVLSPSEMKPIHQLVKKSSFLTTQDKEYIIKHTDPKNPPSDDLYKSWQEVLKYYSTQLPNNPKTSLAQIGVEMASIASNGNKRWLNREIFDLLSHVEKELGVDNLENLQSVGFHLDQSVRAQIKPKDASFDVKEMNEILLGKFKNIKNRIHSLMKDKVFAYEYLPNKDDHRAKTLENLVYLSEQGLGSLGFDKAYGGGGDPGAYMTIFEALAHHDISLTVKFGVQFGLFGGAIQLLGTEKHHRLYLEPTGKGQLLGCFAMTETGHGSNVKSLETTLTYNHNDKTITVNSPNFTSGKEYIGNALHCSMAAVFGQLIIDGKNYGIHAILVPIRKDNQLLDGIKVVDCGYKIGLNGVDNGRLWFDQVKVPVDNLLDKYGGIDDKGQYQSSIANENKRFFTMLGALVAGRICVGSAGISAGKTALTIAIKYALRRRQFGPDGSDEQLIMDYPSHQERLTPLLVKQYAYHFALENLKNYYLSAEDETDKRKIETKAAGIKAKATWLATETIQECRESCGGKGYLWENRFGELKADSDIFSTFEGDNTVLMQLVAKGLLTEFKQSFHDEGFKAVMRFIVGKISFTIDENNPYQSRNSSVDHLMSDEFHSDALRYREKKVLTTLSERMKDYLKKRVNPYDAFLKCQSHMIYLAHCYIDRLIYREMIKTLDTLPGSTSKQYLHTLKKYYALCIIEENKDWYLENDYFEGSKTKAIRRIINKMTQDLRPDLMALVDAFGIPDSALRAEVLG
jgi:acyl-CoA oxidase